jgi:pimeloyl-ACP methyl ester carboxylesterase
MRYTVSPLVGRMLWRPMVKGMFSPLPIDERFRAQPAWMMLRPKQLRASAADTAMMIPAAASLSKRYLELQVPTIILAGTKDKVTDFSHNAERLSERLADSELQLQPGVGHMLHYARTDEVLAAVDAIAAKVGEPVYLGNRQAAALAAASESGS